MVAVVLLALVFVVLAIAGIADWRVDSRDPRFSLWPLNRDTPNDPPARRTWAGSRPPGSNAAAASACGRPSRDAAAPPVRAGMPDQP
jgi:hypothetical protein